MAGGHPKRSRYPTWHGALDRADGRGDTLVVDTVGFNDKSWLMPEGFPHTDQMHMIERYRRVDLAKLTRDVTMIDPGTFTKPLERRIAWQLAPGEELLESICNENNKFLENISRQVEGGSHDDRRTAGRQRGSPRAWPLCSASRRRHSRIIRSRQNSTARSA